MKALLLTVLIPLIAIGMPVSAQPGYYPPPSEVDYHNDTLTVYPPDSLPGEPVVLLGYNIYVDSIFYDDVLVAEPDDTVDFIPDFTTILPGYHTFCAKARYNEWISDQVCDTATVAYGNDLPFLEDWSSGSFEEQQWVSSGQNWVINTEDGNPAPSAVFSGDPFQTGYSMSIESYLMKALGMLNGKIWLDFTLKLDAVQSTGREELIVQVWNWIRREWRSVASYSNTDGSFPWRSEHINIKDFTMNNIFKIRFLAIGENSSDIQNWSIDNIHIYRLCDGIYDIFLEENPDYNLLNWEGLGGSCFDPWIHWDSGQNSGNSIGTGSAVEFDVAARWNPGQFHDYEGSAILEIAYFPAEAQATYRVRVWEGADPDTMVVDQPVDSPLIGQWNYVTLDNPVPLDVTRDLWVGYHVDAQTGYPAGVDAGPAVNGYGNMMYYDSAWQTLLQLNPALNYNWNIEFRIYLGDWPPNWFYKIYRKTLDEEFKYYDSTWAWEYQDSNILLSDHYCYAVTAVWIEYGDTCESNLSDDVCESINIGTEEPVPASMIKIYPNPASNWLNVLSEEDIRNVRIYNLLGELVLEKEIGLPSCILDVSALKSGIYYLNIDTGKKEFRSKIVILR